MVADRKNINVLVTGADGFLGKNLLLHLSKFNKINLIKFTRSDTLERLEELVKRSDFIYHFAGVNRSSLDNDFVSVNIGLTQNLVAIIKKFKLSSIVFYASSTQVSMDNVYGKTKLEGEKLLLKARLETNAQFYIYRFPNLFGKLSKPNYNSVIATFCYNIARSKKIMINDPNNKLELLYVDDVVDKLGKLIKLYMDQDFENYLKENLNPYYIKLGSISDKLVSFKNELGNGILPSVATRFDKALLATFISYIPVKDCILETSDIDCTPSNSYTKKNSWVKGNSIEKLSIQDRKISIILINKSKSKFKFQSAHNQEEWEYQANGTHKLLLIAHPNYHITIFNESNVDTCLQHFYLCT